MGEYLIYFLKHICLKEKFLIQEYNHYFSLTQKFLPHVCFEQVSLFLLHKQSMDRLRMKKNLLKYPSQISRFSKFISLSFSKKDFEDDSISITFILGTGITNEGSLPNLFFNSFTLSGSKVLLSLFFL